jgi:hypothetical protein
MQIPRACHKGYWGRFGGGGIAVLILKFGPRYRRSGQLHALPALSHEKQPMVPTE